MPAERLYIFSLAFFLCAIVFFIFIKAIPYLRFEKLDMGFQSNHVGYVFVLGDKVVSVKIRPEASVYTEAGISGTLHLII